MGKLFSALWGLLLVAVLPSVALAQTVAGSAVDAQSV